MFNSETIDYDGDEGTEDNSAEDADSSTDGESADAKSDEGSDSKAVSLEDYLKANPDAQKEYDTRVQAESDKRFENKRRRDAASARKASQQANAADATRQRTELADKGEFEELGKRAASDDERKVIYDEAAQHVAGFIEETIRARPEIADVLGDEKLEELTNEVRKENGDVIDFVMKLNDAIAESRVGKAMEDQKEAIKTEVEAALKAAGVETRTAESDDGADAELSKSTKASASAGFAKAQDDYIDGKISLDRYEALQEAEVKGKA